MSSRTTSSIARLAKQAIPSSQSNPQSLLFPPFAFSLTFSSASACPLPPPASRLPTRAFSSSPSTLLAPTPTPLAPGGTGSRLYAPSAEAVESHLGGLLRPLGCELRPETAERAMTMKGLAATGGSVREGGGKAQHNEKLVFVGESHGGGGEERGGEGGRLSGWSHTTWSRLGGPPSQTSIQHCRSC